MFNFIIQISKTEQIRIIEQNFWSSYERIILNVANYPINEKC